MLRRGRMDGTGPERMGGAGGRGCAQSPYSHGGFSRVGLDRNLNFKGWGTAGILLLLVLLTLLLLLLPLLCIIITLHTHIYIYIYIHIHIHIYIYIYI